MRKLNLLLLLAIALISACNMGNNPTETNQSAPAVTDETTEVATEDHTSYGNAVELNGGEKWEANFETTRGILNMQSVLTTFDKERKYNLEDYQAVGKKLEKEFGDIFKYCNMTGESHNQLHNYLHPMMAIFETLEGDNLEESKKALDKIKKHLEAYSTYFV